MKNQELETLIEMVAELFLAPDPADIEAALVREAA